MNDDLRTLPPSAARGAPCTVELDGDPVRAFEGEPLAVALFAAGVRTLGRSTKYHRPRGAFCFDGHCASCLLRVDGRPNVRSCRVPVRPGLVSERQNAFPSVEMDLLEAADWLFPQGMDHHTLLTGNRAANRLLVKVVREVGGSGRLPDAPAVALPPVRHAVVDVCIVGAGPAGLAAAIACARAAPDARILLADDQDTPGGSWHAEPGGSARATMALGEARAAGVTVHSGTTAIGFFPEDVDHLPAGDFVRGTLALATPEGLIHVAARRVLYATGSYDQNVPFLDNDRPGVISARACGRLAFRHGVRPGERLAVVGDGARVGALVAALSAVGVAAEGVDDAREKPVAALGGGGLRGLRVAGARERNVDADVVAVAAPPAPASELPRQHGARVVFDGARGGFAVVVDRTFGTGISGVLACGDVTGYVGPAAAALAGTAAGLALARALETAE